MELDFGKCLNKNEFSHSENLIIFIIFTVQTARNMLYLTYERLKFNYWNQYKGTQKGK